ncbi:MAG: pentapeptide repeat-containing protein [Ruminococcus sp.]|nr:pentapeptide repeat-containing protein [Ruminococcus sp.]
MTPKNNNQLCAPPQIGDTELLDTPLSSLQWDEPLTGRQIVQDASLMGMTDVPLWLDQCRVSGLQAAGTGFSGATVQDTIFRRCDFSGADFSGCSLFRVQFLECRMNGVRFLESSCKHVDFSGCSLRMSDFCDTSLTACRFDDCDGSEMRLLHVKMQQILWHCCRLHGLQLSETLLQGQDLSDCALSGLRCLPEALRGVTLDPMQMTELAGIFGIHIKK